MSLCSLRKSQPSVKPVRLSVDDFINQAIEYSKGQRRFCQTEDEQKKLKAFEYNDTCLNKTMKHATFSLSEDAIQQLCALSEQTGISRSRLLRILIAQQHQKDSVQNLSDSSTV